MTSIDIILLIFIILIISAFITVVILIHRKLNRMRDDVNYLNSRLKQEERLNARHRAGYKEYPLA